MQQYRDLKGWKKKLITVRGQEYDVLSIFDQDVHCQIAPMFTFERVIDRISIIDNNIGLDDNVIITRVFNICKGRFHCFDK
jgi:hypothetical protein